MQLKIAMGYILNTEADDKFIGMEISRQPYGDIHVNQEKHIRKIMPKYSIDKTASTPLPSNFSLENYLTNTVQVYVLKNIKKSLEMLCGLCKHNSN